MPARPNKSTVAVNSKAIDILQQVAEYHNISHKEFVTNLIYYAFSLDENTVDDIMSLGGVLQLLHSSGGKPDYPNGMTNTGLLEGVFSLDKIKDRIKGNG